MLSSACDPEELPQEVMPSVRFNSKPHATRPFARRNCQNSSYRSNFPIKAYLSKWTPGKDLSLEPQKKIHTREHLELGFHSSGGYAKEKSLRNSKVSTRRGGKNKA